jgi:alanine-synthesizing transaminase
VAAGGLPMTSRRLRWELSENALAQAVARRRRAGLPLLDLTETNPTRVGLAFEEERILRALADPRALLYDPAPRGLATAREAVARYYAEARGARVDPGRVVLTASTSEAYALLFKLLCDPGDCVLVPEPSYPLFDYLTALEGVSTAAYPLAYDGEWHVDLPALEAALRAQPRARAILAVSPGNPTGAFLAREERARMAALCAERGCAIVCDEVFADFGDPPDDPRRVRTAAEFDDVLSFSLGGLSKACGLPQLKLGWCVAAGPAREVDFALAALELIADTYLSVAAPVQWAAPELLETRHGFQQKLRARLKRNRATLAAARGPGARWDLLRGESGWSEIVSVPRERSEEEWALALLEQGVLVHPGYFFDLPGSHLVLSLLPPEPLFSAAAAALAAVLG